MTETETRKTTAIETVPIPGGGRGVVLPSGEVLNPVFASVKSLVRAGDDEFRAVMAWLLDERAQAVKVQAEREARQREIAATFCKDAELQAAATARLKEEKPWQFS